MKDINMFKPNENYLSIGNEKISIDIGDFKDADIIISGCVKKPWSYRVFNLLTNNDFVEAKISFDSEELKGMSDILYRKHLKKMENTGELTFNVEKTSGAAVIPTKAHPSDSGFDLSTPYDVSLDPGETKLINFHIKLGLQPGWEAQVRNRSGIVVNFKCMIPIGVGTIDSQFTGSIQAPLYNFGNYTQFFKAGSRIAQLVIKRNYPVYIKEGKVYNNNERGSGGFGSTGV